MPEGIRSQFLTLVLGFVTESRPDLASAEVLIQRLRTITLTIQRGQFLPLLQTVLQIPINDAPISITNEESMQPARLGLGSFGAAH